MKYLAYGSNMFSRWMLKDKKVTQIRSGTACLKGYKLAFNKISQDGSGKANVVFTRNPADEVHGVVYELSDEEWEKLKGEEIGYSPSPEPVKLVTHAGVEFDGWVFLADRESNSKKPYSWYHGLIVTGAEESNLPPNYVAQLESIPFEEDPNTDRRKKRLAECLLSEFYKKSGQRNRWTNWS